MKPHKCWRADSEKTSTTKSAATLKLEPKSNKEELKRLTREEEVPRAKESQDNKDLKSNKLPLLLRLLLNNNQLLKLLPLNKSQLRKREKPEEEDLEKVNNDRFVYEFTIL